MLEAESLRRTALILVTLTLVWNLGEAVVALWAGLGSNSVSLLAFGADSIVELFAGGILMWRLIVSGNGEEEEAAERKARRLVGLSFFLLAAYVVLHSGSSLAGWLPEPQPSLAGIVLVIASAIAMSGLYVAKMRVATRIQSRALRAEALESLFCDLQDVAVLIGLGLNALLSWWWAEPVSALILVPLLVKEGLENLSGDEHAHGNAHGNAHAHAHEHDDEDHENANAPLVTLVCFCSNCFFGLHRCRCLTCTA